MFERNSFYIDTRCSEYCCQLRIEFDRPMLTLNFLKKPLHENPGIRKAPISQKNSLSQSIVSLSYNLLPRAISNDRVLQIGHAGISGY